MKKKETTYTTICDICGKEYKDTKEELVFDHRRLRFVLLEDYYFTVTTQVNANKDGRLFKDMDVCKECFIKSMECFVEDLKMGKTKEYKESDDDEY